MLPLAMVRWMEVGSDGADYGTRADALAGLESAFEEFAAVQGGRYQGREDAASYEQDQYAALRAMCTMELPPAVSVAQAWGLAQGLHVIQLVFSHRCRPPVIAAIGEAYGYAAEPLLGVHRPCPTGEGTKPPWRYSVDAPPGSMAGQGRRLFPDPLILIPVSIRPEAWHYYWGEEAQSQHDTRGEGTDMPANQAAAGVVDHLVRWFALNFPRKLSSSNEGNSGRIEPLFTYAKDLQEYRRIQATKTPARKGPAGSVTFHHAPTYHELCLDMEPAEALKKVSDASTTSSATGSTTAISIVLAQTTSSFVMDSRRGNVSLSRAQQLTIVIGPVYRMAKTPGQVGAVIAAHLRHGAVLIPHATDSWDLSSESGRESLTSALAQFVQSRREAESYEEDEERTAMGIAYRVRHHLAHPPEAWSAAPPSAVLPVPPSLGEQDPLRDHRQLGAPDLPSLPDRTRWFLDIFAGGLRSLPMESLRGLVMGAPPCFLWVRIRIDAVGPLLRALQLIHPDYDYSFWLAFLLARAAQGEAWSLCKHDWGRRTADLASRAVGGIRHPLGHTQGRPAGAVLRAGAFLRQLTRCDTEVAMWRRVVRLQSWDGTPGLARHFPSTVKGVLAPEKVDIHVPLPLAVALAKSPDLTLPGAPSRRSREVLPPDTVSSHAAPWNMLGCGEVGAVTFRGHDMVYDVAKWLIAAGALPREEVAMLPSSLREVEQPQERASLFIHPSRRAALYIALGLTHCPPVRSPGREQADYAYGVMKAATGQREHVARSLGKPMLIEVSVPIEAVISIEGKYPSRFLWQTACDRNPGLTRGYGISGASLQGHVSKPAALLFGLMNIGEVYEELSIPSHPADPLAGLAAYMLVHWDAEDPDVSAFFGNMVAALAVAVFDHDGGANARYAPYGLVEPHSHESMVQAQLAVFPHGWNGYGDGARDVPAVPTPPPSGSTSHRRAGGSVPWRPSVPRG